MELAQLDVRQQTGRASMATELQIFLDAAVQRGKMTLNDHLTKAGYVDDHAKRKSMEVQVVRALLGDKYRYLLGTIICPSTNTRAAWAEGIEPLEDTEPKPSFSSSLILQEAVVPIIEKNQWRFQKTDPRLRSAMRAVATASPTKQRLVADGIIAQNDELEYAKEQRDSKTEEVKELKARVKYLEEQVMILLRQIDRSGTDLVPQ